MTEPIDLTVLFDHYRNCRVGLPNRSRKGYCRESDSLYEVVCKLINPVLLYDQYDVWLEQDNSRVAKELKGQNKKK